MTCGILTVTGDFLRYTRDFVGEMQAGHPYLIETLARMSGDTEQFARKMMWVAKSRGWVESSGRNGRVYYTRVR